MACARAIASEMPLTDEPARILVVDDDAASLDLVTTWLQSHGYSVSQAADGNRAVSLGTEEKFDLVILDVHMPTYDGIEILRFLRKRYVHRPVKVIALTGDSTESVRTRLTRYGIDSYMTKPVELKALLDEVQRLLDQAFGHAVGVMRDVGRVDRKHDHGDRPLGGCDHDEPHRRGLRVGPDQIGRVHLPNTVDVTEVRAAEAGDERDALPARARQRGHHALNHLVG